MNETEIKAQVPDSFSKVPEMRIGYWAIWQVSIPLTVITVFWPVHYFLLRTSNAFQCAFSSGDLILFSALLLAGVGVEGKQIEGFYPKSLKGKKLDFWFEIVRGLSFITILGYGIIKYDLLRRGSQIENGLQTGLACFSCSVTFLTVALCFWVLTMAARLTLGGN